MAKEKWIQGAIKHKGALREQLGVPEGEVIPTATLKAAAQGKFGPVAQKRAVFAKTLKGLSKKGKK